MLKDIWYVWIETHKAGGKEQQKLVQHVKSGKEGWRKVTLWSNWGLRNTTDPNSKMGLFVGVDHAEQKEQAISYYVVLVHKVQM